VQTSRFVTCFASFPRGARLKFRLTVTDTASEENGFAEVTLAVRAPPTGGSFTITPATGMAQATSFRVTAAGWIGGGALTYQYAVINWLDGSAIPFGRSPGTPVDFDAIFNSGPPSSNYLIQVTLTVSDLSGSSATVMQTIQVTPNTFLLGTSVASASARMNTLAQRVSTYANTRSIPSLISYVNAQASVEAHQSANVTGALTAGILPRCLGLSTFSSAVQWTPRSALWAQVTPSISPPRMPLHSPQ
jgi:hypothetical protein